MSYKLKGRKVLVTGGSRGLGALVAEKFANEGCDVAVNYNASKESAERLVARLEEEYSIKTVAIHGDMGILVDCERTIQEARDGLGGLDIIVSNAGWTKFTTFEDLDALNEAEWDKCWAVNCKANLHLLRKALPTFNANPDGGTFILTSSVAGVAATGSTMAYSVTKAAGESPGKIYSLSSAETHIGLHLVKCLAATQGPKIRVNAVAPGLLLTDWGQNFTPEKIQSSKDKAYLKKETNLEDCADGFIAIAKNGSMTGQVVQIDSGVSMLGR